MTTNQLMLKLFKELKKEMNGAVVTSMQDYGTDYHLTYGVSVATIKTVASRYFPNHDLAVLLLSKDVRELRLAAIFIENPAKLDVGAMNLWAGIFSTHEMVEQSTMNILWKSPKAFEMSKIWLSDSRIMYIRAALMICGKLAANHIITAAQMQEFLPMILNVSSNNDFNVKNGTVYALREMALSSKEMLEVVLKFLDQLHEKRSPAARDIAYDVRWQIQPN